MNESINLLDLLSDLYATSVDFEDYLQEADAEQTGLMLKVLINKVKTLNEFIFDNIDLDKFEE
jgi:hypothetical protein